MAVFRKAAFWLGMAALAGGMAMIVVGFTLRVLITRWAPVTNMFETIVFVALCVGLLGMWFASRPLRGQPATEEILQTLFLLVTARHRLVGPAYRLLRPRFSQGNTTADARAAEQLVAGRSRHDNRRRLRGGGPGLGRGQHCLGLLLAWAISAGQAAAELRRPGRRDLQDLQIAILLLILGTFLGALWADVSWGRFWGWDPKEVWALISILVYIADRSRPVGRLVRQLRDGGRLGARRSWPSCGHGTGSITSCPAENTPTARPAGGGLMGWSRCLLFAVAVLLVSGILLIAAPMRYCSANNQPKATREDKRPRRLRKQRSQRR